MQLAALRHFAIVADHGSFNAAARWLGVSTSTLTRSVSGLEDDLGLTLFERSRGGVRLAPSALPVLEETKRMLASLDAVASAAEGAARGLVGELRLGVRSPPLGEPLRGMLARWHEEHPDVRLIIHELSDHEIFTELVARRIDVALVPSFAPWPQIVMEPLYRERMVAAVPKDHALAGRDTLRWTDLHHETIFVQEWAQSHAMREFYASMMGVGLPLQSVPAGKQTVFSLVSAGFGVTLAQQSQAEVLFPGVVFKPVDEDNARVEFCLAWSRQSECAVIGRFLASMRASAARRSGASPISEKETRDA
jgi:DNA-binding transcriptional LysR family regulator